MEEKLIEKEGEEPAEEKRAYTPPTLTVYGKLTELTGGGPNLPAEGSHTSDPNRRT